MEARVPIVLPISYLLPRSKPFPNRVAQRLAQKASLCAHQLRRFSAGGRGSRSLFQDGHLPSCEPAPAADWGLGRAGAGAGSPAPVPVDPPRGCWPSLCCGSRAPRAIIRRARWEAVRQSSRLPWSPPSSTHQPGSKGREPQTTPAGYRSAQGLEDALWCCRRAGGASDEHVTGVSEGDSPHFGPAARLESISAHWVRADRVHQACAVGPGGGRAFAKLG